MQDLFFGAKPLYMWLWCVSPSWAKCYNVCVSLVF